MTRWHQTQPSSIDEEKGEIPKKPRGREEAAAAPRRHLLPLRRPNAKSILHTPKWLFGKGLCSGEVNGGAQPS